MRLEKYDGTLCKVSVFVSAGLLPGPILFGYLIDTACELWQDTCGKKGNCLLYDSDKFRLRTFGPSAAFVFCTFIIYIALVIVSKKKDAETSDNSFDSRHNGTMDTGNREILLDVNENEKNSKCLPETDV